MTATLKGRVRASELKEVILAAQIEVKGTNWVLASV